MTRRGRNGLLIVAMVLGLLSACVVDPSPVARVSGTPVPQPPAGTRWQGTGRVVVAVPRDWGTSTEPCPPAANAVWMTSNATSPVPCPLVRARGSVLQVGGTDLGLLPHRTEVRGIEVRHSSLRCRTGPSGPCTLEFAVPRLDASFRIFYLGPSPAAFVDRMMRSVTLLQPGLTTVPVIPYGAAVDDAKDVLGEAGLVATSPEVDFPHYVTGTRPAAGLLAGNGETVRLSIGDG